MGRGGRRPGAGRKPRSFALHVLGATVRRDRGHERPAPSPPGALHDWAPRPEDVAALGPWARDWLEATCALYQLTALDGQRLLECCRVLHRVEVLDRTAGMATAAALIQERRLFLAMWSAFAADFARDA